MSPFIASHNSLLGSKAAVKRAGLVQTSLGSPWQPALQEPFLPFPSFLFCCCCCCVIKTSRIESPPGCSAGTAPDLLPASSQLPWPFLIPCSSRAQPQPSKAQSKLSPSPAKPSPALHQDIFSCPTSFLPGISASSSSAQHPQSAQTNLVPPGWAVQEGFGAAPRLSSPSCSKCWSTQGAVGDLQNPCPGTAMPAQAQSRMPHLWSVSPIPPWQHRWHEECSEVEQGTESKARGLELLLCCAGCAGL